MVVLAGFQVLLGSPGQTWAQRISSQLGYSFFLGIVVLSLLPAFMLDSIRFSNRFVGPLARMRRAMRELSEYGNTEELRFRDGDFWADAASEFNEMRKHYRHYRQLCETHRLVPTPACPAESSSMASPGIL
jgi:hypothetical protein